MAGQRPGTRPSADRAVRLGHAAPTHLGKHLDHPKGDVREPKDLESPSWTPEERERDRVPNLLRSRAPINCKATLFFNRASFGQVFCHIQPKETSLPGGLEDWRQARHRLKPRL